MNRNRNSPSFFVFSNNKVKFLLLMNRIWLRTLDIIFKQLEMKLSDKFGHNQRNILVNCLNSGIPKQPLECWLGLFDCPWLIYHRYEHNTWVFREQFCNIFFTHLVFLGLEFLTQIHFRSFVVTSDFRKHVLLIHSESKNQAVTFSNIIKYLASWIHQMKLLKVIK